MHDMYPLILGAMMLCAYLSMFAGLKPGAAKNAMLALTLAVGVFALISAIFELRFDFEPVLAAMINRLVHGLVALGVIVLVAVSYFKDFGEPKRSSRSRRSSRS